MTKWKPMRRYTYHSQNMPRLIDWLVNGEVLNFYRGYDCLVTGVDGDPGLLVAKSSLAHSPLPANKRKTAQCVNEHKPGDFGGWNVRSCCHIYKQQLITKQLSEYNIQIAAICVTGMYESGVKTVGSEWTIKNDLLRTAYNESSTRAAHGVAFWLDRTVTTAWKRSRFEWVPVSGRILRFCLNRSPTNVTLTAVYSPVNPSTNNKADCSDKLYVDLQVTLDRVQKADMLIIMGDLNARLGSRKHLTAPHRIGPFPTDIRNENGVWLLPFCLSNDLMETNTSFQHQTFHQTSWIEV